jgi:GntR family transcriptional regulator / MocR family aminotransferase
LKNKSPVRPQRFPFETLTINHSSTTALFRQLENQLREAIWQGLLAPGERLPSTRRLAKDLTVARNTVINAYEQLTVEGFIETIQGSGTRVTQGFPQRKPPLPITTPPTAALPNDEPSAPLTLSSRYQHAIPVSTIISLDDATPARPFRAHIPACNEFPSSQWAQLMTRKLRQQPQHWLEKSPPLGYAPLREAIARYLGVSRGLSTQAKHIMITAGAQQAVELLAKTFINLGDIVCFEEPGYTPAAISFKMAGANVITVPVDEQGINVEVLNKTVPKAKFVYVTPSHHFPLGITLSQSRRKALLQWASESGAVILEDDYNGEYQYRGRPLATLHAMANPRQVIYLGSFSKLLFPALRLGYMVVPLACTEPLAAIRWLIDRHSPPLEQAVLADFIDQGHFARHLRRMRPLYVERQQALIDAAQDFLAGIMTVPPLDSGLHLIGWLEHGVKESDVLAAANDAGIEITPTSAFSSKPPQNPSVILGYAAYTSEEIRHKIKILADGYRAKCA